MAHNQSQILVMAKLKLSYIDKLASYLGPSHRERKFLVGMHHSLASSTENAIDDNQHDAQFCHLREMSKVVTMTEKIKE